jgi:hypothetical protein
MYSTSYEIHYTINWQKARASYTRLDYYLFSISMKEGISTINEKNIARAIAIGTIIGLFALGNASGVFATFWRTMGLNPTNFEYGYGYGAFGYGYGYGYGYGIDNSAGYYYVPTAAATVDNFGNPYVVTTATFPSVSEVEGTDTSATSVRVTTSAVFNPTGQVRVTLPNGLVITGANSNPVDITTLAAASLTTPTVSLPSDETTNGVLNFWVTGTSLHFSKPVKVEIPTNVTGPLLAVKVNHGNGQYSTSSLTNDPTATCTNGISSSITNTAVVSNGIATIYTCAASQFVTYTAATTTNNSSGGAALTSNSSSTTTSHGTTVVKTSTDTSTTLTTTTSSGSTTKQFTKPKIVITNTSKILAKDISKNWAKDFIHRLMVRGVVNNSTEFKPDNNLTRAEFLKIVYNASGQEVSEISETTFNDVSSTAWYAPYVSLALKQGVISAKNTNFRPNDTITRGEVAKILVGVFGVSPQADAMSFFDVDSTSDLAKYIETTKSLGIFQGQKNAAGKLIFRPNDAITRAEIAKVVVTGFGL